MDPVLDVPELKSSTLFKKDKNGNHSLNVGNYAKFKTFNDLATTVLSEVKPGWLVNKEVNNIFLSSLKSIYKMAKEDEDINYCPKPERLMTVFKAISPDEVKVVITAQDPYPNLLDAIGVAFASPAPPKHIPRSAQAINSCLWKNKHITLRERESAQYGTWVGREKILLVNASLTVEERVLGRKSTNKSHAIHWKDVIPAFLSLIPKKSVAVLFGQDAGQLFSSIKVEETVKHVHPVARASTVQRDSDLPPFEEKAFVRYNNGYWEKIDVFTEINERLKRLSLKPINWSPGPPGPSKLDSLWAKMKGWT